MKTDKGREVSPDDKALSADWLKRIDTAKGRHEDQFKQFAVNRRLLRGVDRHGDKIKQNLYFANLAAMRPQIYAKDPEFALKPTMAVGDRQIEAAKRFSRTGEAVLTRCLVKDARLKKRAKRMMTSAYTTSVGWLKCSWQDGDKKKQPLIENQLKETQDNLNRIQTLRDRVADPESGRDTELQVAQLKEAIAGLQEKAEVVVNRGLALDFVHSEDLICLDDSVREFGDYLRSSALANRVYMTRGKYESTFGYRCEKGKSYSQQQATASITEDAQSEKDGSRMKELLCVWEIWEQDSNRVFTVCEGEEGFCKETFSPDWTGTRWYPFFGVAFNEAEGSWYPLSDVELTEPQITEINRAQADFEKDRKGSLPVNIVRKGGSMTDVDLNKIKNRQGGDIIVVEGVGQQPIQNDIFSGQLSTIRPENYSTDAARAFMEMIVGGGDAARGTVMKAKTATEAEIMSQGLRGRSAERTDIIEDLLAELGEYALQILLRKLSEEEVQRIAGPDAMWPTLTPDDIFEMVAVEVRAGSTGKPDRLQDQDRWTKLMPVIEKVMAQVAQLREAGNNDMAEAMIALLRETLRRFDERLDLEQYFPTPKEGEEKTKGDPQAAAQLQAAVAEIAQLQDQLKAAQADVEKAKRDAAVKLATAAMPSQAITAFTLAQQVVDQGVAAPMLPPAGMPDPAMGMAEPEIGGKTQGMDSYIDPQQSEGMPPMSGPEPDPTAEMPQP